MLGGSTPKQIWEFGFKQTTIFLEEKILKIISFFSNNLRLKIPCNMKNIQCIWGFRSGDQTHIRNLNTIKVA